MVVINYYNSDNKTKFIDTIVEPGRKNLAITTFNKMAKYEYKLRKDIYNFTMKEILHAFLDSSIVLYRPYIHGRAIINEWRAQNGKSPVELPDEETYKQMFIDNGNIDYVMSQRDLLFAGYDAIQKYSDEVGYDCISYFSMPLLYELLVFEGLTDEQILSINRREIIKDYVLPNGKTISDPEIIKLVDMVANATHYTLKRSEQGTDVIRTYDNSYALIRLKIPTLTRTFSKLGNSLSDSKIRTASKFYQAFEKDISAHNFKVILSRYQVRVRIKDKDSMLHGFSPADEEMYQIYKGVRMKHSI